MAFINIAASVANIAKNIAEQQVFLLKAEEDQLRQKATLDAAMAAAGVTMTIDGTCEEIVEVRRLSADLP